MFFSFFSDLLHKQKTLSGVYVIPSSLTPLSKSVTSGLVLCRNFMQTSVVELYYPYFDSHRGMIAQGQLVSNFTRFFLKCVWCSFLINLTIQSGSSYIQSGSIYIQSGSMYIQSGWMYIQIVQCSCGFPLHIIVHEMKMLIIYWKLNQPLFNAI